MFLKRKHNETVTVIANIVNVTTVHSLPRSLPDFKRIYDITTEKKLDCALRGSLPNRLRASFSVKTISMSLRVRFHLCRSAGIVCESYLSLRNSSVGRRAC